MVFGPPGLRWEMIQFCFSDGWFNHQPANYLSRLHCPKQSMYGIVPYMYHKNQPNVGKHTIHGLVWVW